MLQPHRPRKGANRQKQQIEELLQDVGWQIVERDTLRSNYWFDEVWTLESEWSPRGQRCYVTFVIDRHVASVCRQPGDDVASVAVSLQPPTQQDFGHEIYLRSQWERNGLPELRTLLASLRQTGNAR